MDGLNHWIPAFAGMTERAEVRNLARMAKGLSGWQQTCSLLVVIPAKAGIQEGKGAVMKGRQVLPDSALGCHTCCHSRKAGMDD